MTTAIGMRQVCPECGAEVPAAGSCRDNFHALLVLESQVRGVDDLMLHFYAVACYGLQHPRSMNYTADAAEGLRAALADALDGRATIEDLRRRARQGARASGRVTRREGDPQVTSPTGNWPITVTDVLSVEPEAWAYTDRVLTWARSVRETLEGGRT